jgi:hypothetical protein
MDDIIQWRHILAAQRLHEDVDRRRILNLIGLISFGHDDVLLLSDWHDLFGGVVFVFFLGFCLLVVLLVGLEDELLSSVVCWNCFHLPVALELLRGSQELYVAVFLLVFTV